MLYVVYAVTCFLSFASAGIYYVHMFQLNGYHKNAHMKWFGDTLGASAARLTPAALAFVASLLPFDAAMAAATVLNVISVLFNLPHEKAKKPLVYTARIKRLLFTMTLIFAIFAVFGGMGKYVRFLPALAVAISNFAVLFADILNSPFEKAVKNYYINDAKKILASRKRLKVIGITGSYGKTSCKNYLAKLLGAKYNVLITPASYNTPMGVVKTIRENLKSSHEIFICEMGAKNIGDIKELCDIIHPDFGLIASVGYQHLESFKSIENVTNTKFELYDAIKAGGKTYLNYDNEFIREKSVDKNAIVSYGTENTNADCVVKNVKLSSKGTDFDLEYGGRLLRLSTKLLGMHNVQNIAGCVAIALDFGVSEADIALAVKRLETVEHRLQIIDGGDITIIDDAFNANPSGTKAALEVLSGFDGIKIIVTPGMIELGAKQSEFNRRFGEDCTKVCDYILIVGGRIADDVYNGAAGTDFDKEKILRFDKVEPAVAFARSLEGDKRKYVLLENDLPDNY